MKRKSISIIALLLALLMLISTGCGKKTEEPQVINDVPVSNVPVVPVEGGNEDEYEPLSGEFFYSLIYDTVLYEGSDTFRVLKYTDDGMYASVDDGSGARICLFYGDNEMTYLSKYAPATENGVPGSPVFMDIDTDGRLILIENVEGYTENADGTYTYHTSYYVRSVAEDGTMLTSNKLEGVESVNMYGGAALGAGGTVAIASKNCCTFYDYSGKKLNELKIDGLGEDGLVKLKDGRVAAYAADSNKIVIVDALADGKTEEFSVPGTIYGGDLISGAGYYDLCYTCGTDFYGYNIAEQKADKLFNWINAGIVYDELQAIRLRDDGTVSAVKYDWSYFYDSCTVNKVDIRRIAAETDTRTKLSIAATYSDYTLWYNIIDFNSIDQNYKIELIDYSVFDTAENNRGAAEALMNDIKSGSAADVIYVAQLSQRDINALCANGAFEDLYTYLKKDDSVTTEDLMPAVLKACEFDGKLYYTASDFSVLTYAGLSSMVGNESKLSFNQLNDARKHLGGANPSVFSLNYDQFNVLNDYLKAVNDYVDFTDGAAFNKDAFLSRLGVASLASLRKPNAPADDFERVGLGHQLLVRIQVDNASEIASAYSLIGKPLSFVGLPVEEGSGNMIDISKGYAINAKGENKDGAWEFIRTFLTEEYQTGNALRLPVNKAALQAQAKTLIDAYYTPKTGSNITADNVLDSFMKLAESAGRVASDDENIMQIARESCAGFFASSDSAGAAADKFGVAIKDYLK
ncbi:MAG: extracellular solute-binding protein [Oscillospiraceae bacterium]|nr:extracellular solute-binding protein [Oscillospiraceae bacterium]